MNTLEAKLSRRPPSTVVMKLSKTNYDVSKAIPAVLQEKREQPILTVPTSFYQLELQSMSCDVKLPVFQPLLSGVDANTTIYEISMKYNGLTKTHTVQYVPQTKNIPSTNQEYYRVYNYSHVVDEIINPALKDCFDSLAAAESLPTAKTPYIIINPETKKLSVVLDKAGFDSNLASPIEIFFDRATERLLGGFPYDYDDSSINTYAQLKAFANSSNEVSDSGDIDIYIEQEYSSPLSTWSSVKSIALIASTMPIRGMLLGIDNGPEYAASDASSSALTSSRSLNIITEIPVNEMPSGSTITYHPQYKKLIDMTNQEQFQQIYLQFYYSDSAHYHPLTLPVTGHMEVVLAFHLRQDL